jgi:hypothetical protein
MINLRRAMTETPPQRWVVPPVVLGCSADRDRLGSHILQIQHPHPRSGVRVPRHRGCWGSDARA